MKPTAYSRKPVWTTKPASREITDSQSRCLFGSCRHVYKILAVYWPCWHFCTGSHVSTDLKNSASVFLLALTSTVALPTGKWGSINSARAPVSANGIFVLHCLESCAVNGFSSKSANSASKSTKSLGTLHTPLSPTSSHYLSGQSDVSEVSVRPVAIASYERGVARLLGYDRGIDPLIPNNRPHAQPRNDPGTHRRYIWPRIPRNGAGSCERLVHTDRTHSYPQGGGAHGSAPTSRTGLLLPEERHEGALFPGQ